MRQAVLWEQLPEEPAPGLREVELFLDVLSEFDEALVRELERRRGRGRNDYPVVAMWNLYAVQALLRHSTTAQALEELGRNWGLAKRLGFRREIEGYRIPDSHNCSRFQALLKEPEIYRRVEDAFRATVARLKEAIPDLGRHCAGDATDIRTHAKPPSKDGTQPSADPDASWSVKTKRHEEKDGHVREETECTFGYKHYAVVDVQHAVVLAVATETGSASDCKQVEPLLAQTVRNVGEGEVETVVLDKGFDSADTIELAYEWGVKAVVPFRDVPQNLDALPPEDREVPLEGTSNVVRDRYTGEVACYDGSGPRPVRRRMLYAGFEASRGCHKFRCPVAGTGQRCRYFDRCQAGLNGANSRQVRVPMSVDPRRFAPIYPHSKRWARRYRGRSAVERYNAYVKNVLRLDQHCLRGVQAIRLRALLCAMTVNIRALLRVRQDRSPEAEQAAAA